MVVKTEIEKMDPGMTSYGSIDPEIIAEPGTPLSVASQRQLRVNPLVRSHWQRNLWYYVMILFTSLLALFLISRVVFLILKVNGVHSHNFPADAIDTNPVDPDPEGQKRCRLCNFKECEANYCPRMQTNCTKKTLSASFFLSLILTYSLTFFIYILSYRHVHQRYLITACTRMQQECSPVVKYPIL
jgi:hypothetical protein